MLNVIKRELEIDTELKKRIEVICSFCNTRPIFINGSIRKIDKTNLSYVEPHRVLIENKLFLVFNYSNEIYINDLSNKIELSSLKEYLKNNK